ncbi:MAG: hypothetical protein V3T83_01010 [Acidobacteriota bacterium]
MVTRENSDYKDIPFHLEDSCAHGSEKISVTVKNGEILSVSPETVWVQQGGG